MDSNRKKDLHRRYLTRELSPEELEAFFNMLSEGDAEDIADFDEVAAAFPTALEPKENIAKKILGRTDPKRNRRLFIQRSAAAVIAILMLFGGYQGYEYYRFIEKTKTFSIVRVPVGKMTELKLEDGTQITLTSGTLFKYPKAFTKTERRVYLIEGQAFFKVAHDKTKPFRVNSGKLSTTALGTSFMIRHYKDYSYEKVSLYTGKVRIDRNGINARPVILSPGQEYDYHRGTLSTVMGFDNSADPIGTGTLTFKRAAFRDAIYSMSSFYRVKILFNEAEFKDFNISGNFNSNSIDQILHSLTFIYPFKIHKTDSLTYNLIRIENRK